MVDHSIPLQSGTNSKKRSSDRPGVSVNGTIAPGTNNSPAQERDSELEDCPAFIRAMEKIAEAVEKTDFDKFKVKRMWFPPK